MRGDGREDDAPAVPAPAEPEEPQTSVHEQEITPEPADEDAEEAP